MYITGALGGASVSIESLSTTAEKDGAKWGVASLTSANQQGVKVVKPCVDFVAMVTMWSYLAIRNILIFRYKDVPYKKLAIYEGDHSLIHSVLPYSMTF